LNLPSTAESKTAAAPPVANDSPDKSADNATGTPNGLTSDEAGIRLRKFGPNAMPDTTLHPLRSALSKFWTPVPWMLEAAIVLEVVLGKYVEAAVIAALLDIQRRPRVLPGVARAGNACRAEVAAGAERVGPARWIMEYCAGGRPSAGRYRKVVPGRSGGCRRASARGGRFCSTSPC